MSFTETIQLINGREARINMRVNRYTGHFGDLLRLRYRGLLLPKKYPAKSAGKIKSPKDWITWKYCNNRRESGFPKSESEFMISIIPVPKRGLASIMPNKNVMAKLVITSNKEKRILVKGVRLSRMGGFCKSMDFGYFCG
jgi:hypothetical protein